MIPSTSRSKPRTVERAAIVSIGDEFTIGQSLDTNSKWLSERLTALGLTVIEHVTVPDHLALIVAATRRLVEACGTVIITGGLGPTADDLTRDALAEVLGEPLVEDCASLVEIERWFARSSRPMPERNRVQALRPVSGVHLPNPNGTAPGIRVSAAMATLHCLPGPPSEMRPMFELHVRPHTVAPAGRVIRTRVLQAAGLGESDVAERLGGLMDRDRNPLVGTTASGGIVSVRVRDESSDSAALVDARVEATLDQVRRAIDSAIFAEDDRPLATIIVERLRSRHQRLSVVESCTGGMLGQAITAVPGSSDAFAGGWITYSNELKRALVGVSGDTLDTRGAVSAEVASAMARGGLERSAADHTLAITGVAGPGGGSDAKPVGTVWIALASQSGPPDVRRFHMRGEREAIRAWSVTSALLMLDQRLRGVPMTRLLRQAEP
jgi:nicotinamide-nucleotide amidase